MRNILFVDNSLEMFLNFRGTVMESFLDKGYDVSIIVPKVKNEALFEAIPNSVKLIEVDFEPTNMNPLRDVRFLSYLYRYYKRIRPDIIFHYTIKPNIYGTLVASFLSIKCVSMVAGLGYVFNGGGMKRCLGRLLYKFALRKAGRVLVLNRMNYQYLLTNKYVSAEKLCLLAGGEGIDLTRFCPGRF